jgi:hypothetical protein
MKMVGVLMLCVTAVSSACLEPSLTPLTSTCADFGSWSLKSSSVSNNAPKTIYFYGSSVYFDTQCTFIIQSRITQTSTKFSSNTIYGLGMGDTACAGIDFVTCSDCDKVGIVLLNVSTTTDMDFVGTMNVAFGRSDSCLKNSSRFYEYTNSDALLHCASEGDVFLRAGCYTTVAIWILVTSSYIYNKKLRCHPNTFIVTRRFACLKISLPTSLTKPALPPCFISCYCSYMLYIMFIISPHSCSTMEGIFSVIILAVFYSGEAGRNVCESHPALSYVNQV